MGYDETKSVEANKALAMYEIAAAIRGLLYGLKYSTGEGMSIAEAIEVSGKKIADALGDEGEALVDRAA